MRDIYLAHLDKARPAVVLTRASTRSVMTNVTLAVITSTVKGLTTEVPVGVRNGLDHDSVISCDNITTVPASALIRQIGFLLDDQEPALRAAVLRALDL